MALFNPISIINKITDPLGIVGKITDPLGIRKEITNQVVNGISKITDPFGIKEKITDQITDTIQDKIKDFTDKQNRKEEPIKKNQESQIQENIENIDKPSNYSGSRMTASYNKDINKTSDVYNSFNPYRLPDNEEPFIKGIPMIFMTKPSLNFDATNISTSNFLIDLASNDPDILVNLSSNIELTPFIPIITNKFKEINLKDLTTRTKEMHETYSGYKQLIPGSYIESIVSDDLSIKFSETKNLGIIKTHKAWMDYVERVRRGMMKPSEDSLKYKYIDYTSSVYFFLLDFDLSTILFYTKYTGVIPISLPYSNFGGDITNRDLVDVDINYVYSFKEDLEPEIILDFNAVAKKTAEVFKRKEISNTDLIEENNDLDPYKDLYDSNENFRFNNVEIVRCPIDKELKNKYNINNSYNYNKSFVYKLKFS